MLITVDRQFDLNNQQHITNWESINALKCLLTNYLLSSNYERPFNLEYGLNLDSYLFDISNFEEIKEKVEYHMKQNYPSELESIEVTVQGQPDDQNVLFIGVDMTVRGKEESVVFKITN